MMHCLSAGSLFDIKGMIFRVLLCDTIWVIHCLVCITVLFKIFGEFERNLYDALKVTVKTYNVTIDSYFKEMLFLQTFYSSENVFNIDNNKNLFLSSKSQFHSNMLKSF